MIMNAYEELMEYLEEGEEVEALAFGEWGWGNDSFYGPPEGEEIAPQGCLMKLEDARKYMQGWRFGGGYGAPECYATYIWTNKRIIWVTQYDGSTGLDSAPRNPAQCMPNMPGG
jgi:hypothetical protein